LPPRKPFQSAIAAADTRRLLRERTGRANVLLAGRGAAAIWAALRALDLHNRPVLIPANTCYIVLWAVLQSGNQPVLVDVDPATATLSTDTLDRCAALNPAAVIPAHMYGLPAPMASICAWAKARGALVIEDAALALGTLADGRLAGSWGDASILSFGDGKIADAGGGGALLTDDPALAAEAERLLVKLPEWTNTLARLNTQWLEIYWALHQYEAENPRLAELYPALFSIYGAITRCHLPGPRWRGLRAVLQALEGTLEHRRDLAHFYDAALADTPLRRFERPESAILWRYPARAPRQQRDGLLRALWSESLDAARWYPSLQPMCQALAPDAAQGDTPEADALAAEIVNLPLSPDTTLETAQRVVAVIRDYFGGAES
jgi:dTDP-4-amino-4,6-dideoxygalactose transaminase